MSEEELKQEAEKNILNLKNNSIKVSGKPFQINEGDYTQGFFDGAEPREKQIADLKQEKRDLADCNARLLSQAAAATKRIIQQEEENENLKKRLELLNLNANIATRDLNDLLTKAKELLKQWQQADICDSVVLFADTEQFLKEIEK